MRKTLALLLAAAVLYFSPSHPVSTKSQTVASGKFFTVANPIPNRYIVVLATTDLSPIATPTPTPKSATPVIAKSPDASAMSTELSESSATPFFAEPVPEPQVVTTATDLTAAYGGTFSDTWSAALKGFRLHRSEEHTSELQSQSNLVCRLLLEKKK